MDMEELNKSQIILLALFVSFITSIATGIVTVSLVQQAPPVITQTVSRVIQETVQAVTPASASQHAAATLTQEKTVVLNESDLISSAVSRATPSLVRLYTVEDQPVFLGLGIVLDAEGTVATDADALGESADATVVTSDGTSLHGSVRARDPQSGIAYLVVATSSAQSAPTLMPVSVAHDHVVLGQSVVVLSGKSTPRIGNGLVAALMPTTSASTSPQVIDTNLSADSILPGSPLIDTQGAVVGISTGLARAVSASGFISASTLTEAGLSGQ